MIKQCLICGKEFETVKHGDSRKYCFNCSPSYRKNDNISRGQTITAIRHALKSQLVKESGGKCVKCGYDKYPAVLEFHHLNPTEKEFTISDFTGSSSVKIEKAREEVKKCALLCANCHREFHYLNDLKKLSFEDFIIS